MLRREHSALIQDVNFFHPRDRTTRGAVADAAVTFQLSILTYQPVIVIVPEKCTFIYSFRHDVTVANQTT
jgi:hypothetical protein